MCKIREKVLVAHCPDSCKKTEIYIAESEKQKLFWLLIVKSQKNCLITLCRINGIGGGFYQQEKL